MPTSAETSFLSFLRRAAPLPGFDEVSDGDLLTRFAADRDEVAFTMLVRRHGPMVLGVARRVLRNGHAAEDVFQATFLALVRQANSLRKHGAIAGWLYRVAIRTSHRARRQNFLPLTTTIAAPDCTATVEQSEIRCMLDSAVQRLPEKLRLSIIFCYFAGHSTDEAARLLNCPLGTIHSRLAAARDKLRKDLVKRGVTISAPALLAVLSSDAKAAAVSATLLMQTLRVAGPAAALTPAVLSLAKGTLAMTWIKAVAMSGVAMATVVGLGVAIAGPRQTEPTTSVEKQRSQETPKSVAKQKEHELTDEERKQVKEWLRDAAKDAQGEDNSLPSRTLADIAIAQQKVGDAEESKKTFQKASDIVDGLLNKSRDHPPFVQSATLEYRELAKAFARAGQVDRALDIVAVIRKEFDPTSVPGGINSSVVLGECARELAVARSEKDALLFVGQMTDESRKAWELPAVQGLAAVALAKAGKLPAALEAVDRIKTPLEQVMALAGNFYKNQTFDEYPHEDGIAILQAKSAKKAEAELTLQRAEKLASTLDNKERDRAIGAIACAQARLGNLAESARLLPELDPVWRALATGAYVKALAVAGKNDEANAAIELIDNKGIAAHALMHFATGQARAGNREAAKRTFEKAADAIRGSAMDGRGILAHNLAAAQARAGFSTAALKTVEEFLPDGNESVAMSIIIAAVARDGDYAGALKFIDRISERERWWWKGNCLRYIAKAQVENGKLDDALVWIKQLTSPDERANALLGAAEGRITPAEK